MGGRGFVLALRTTGSCKNALGRLWKTGAGITQVKHGAIPVRGEATLAALVYARRQRGQRGGGARHIAPRQILTFHVPASTHSTCPRAHKQTKQQIKLNEQRQRQRGQRQRASLTCAIARLSVLRGTRSSLPAPIAQSPRKGIRMPTQRSCHTIPFGLYLRAVCSHKPGFRTSKMSHTSPFQWRNRRLK